MKPVSDDSKWLNRPNAKIGHEAATAAFALYLAAPAPKPDQQKFGAAAWKDWEANKPQHMTPERFNVVMESLKSAGRLHA